MTVTAPWCAVIPVTAGLIPVSHDMDMGINLPYTSQGNPMAVLVKAVTTSTKSTCNFLRCTGYHGNLSVLVIAVNHI